MTEERSALRRDPLKAQFLAAAAIIVLLFLLYAWQTVARVRSETTSELAYVNRMFVEGTRATLIAQHSRLLMAGEQLRAAGATEDPERGRALIEELAALDSGIVAFGFARADGQLVLVSGVPAGEPLPNLLEVPAAREGFERAVRSRDLSLGRPYHMTSLEQWVIPLRVPLPEADGSVRWVMTAGLSTDGGNTTWARLELPPEVGIVLVREDGYLQYASTVRTDRVGAQALRELYGEPLAPGNAEEILAVAASGAGTAVLQRPRLGGELLVSVIRLPEYGLVSLTGIAVRSLRAKATGELLPPLLLVLGVLLAVHSAYRFARRSQLRHDERLLHLAHHDPLTRLPNRSLVLDRLRQALAISVRQERSAALLFVDLDNFKVINDTYGHRFGDELIRRMAAIFAEAVRPGDTVARLGGDEFLIVLPELVDDGDAKLVAERVLARFRTPIEIEGHQIYTSASIGIAVGPRDSDDPEELMRHADIALYDAKGRGRNGYSFFDPRLNEAARRRTEVERNLRQALASGELRVVYQPIHRPGRPVRASGAEALVRWTSPVLGPVPPDEFIRVAEEVGLVEQIGLFVMGRAAADFAVLNRELGFDFKVSVNVSANEFRSGNLVERVRRQLQETGLAARNLMLELTESVMIEDLARVKAQLVELRRLGVSIAVDDFGTGYSSLSYLNRLPITTLKIDRSFVRDLCADAEDRALVRSIVALGHGLDLLVVAEGVETAEQVDVLTGIGCDLLQGYFFSAPVPLERLRELLAAQGAGPREGRGAG